MNTKMKSVPNYMDSFVELRNIFSRIFSQTQQNNIRVSRHLDYQVMQLVGSYDLSNCQEIRDALLFLMKQEKSVLIDFSRLTFIDCCGLATLVEGFDKAQCFGGSVAILAANGSPLQLLKLTNLNYVFTLFESLEDIKT